jgi:hypothetical protein
MVMPFMAAFFGIMCYVAQVRYQITYDKTPNKIWAVAMWACLGYALLQGFSWISYLRDFTYLQTVINRKQLIAHYLALGVPALCIFVIAYRIWRVKRYQSQSRYRQTDKKNSIMDHA